MDRHFLESHGLLPGWWKGNHQNYISVCVFVWVFVFVYEVAFVKLNLSGSNSFLQRERGGEALHNLGDKYETSSAYKPPAQDRSPLGKHLKNLISLSNKNQTNIRQISNKYESNI